MSSKRHKCELNTASINRPVNRSAFPTQKTHYYLCKIRTLRMVQWENDTIISWRKVWKKVNNELKRKILNKLELSFSYTRCAGELWAALWWRLCFSCQIKFPWGCWKQRVRLFEWKTLMYNFLKVLLKEVANWRMLCWGNFAPYEPRIYVRPCVGCNPLTRF